MSAPSSDDEDDELARAAACGDTAAFTALFHRYGDRVYGLSLSMLREDAAALDAVQDTFATAWQKLGTWRGDAPVRPWLMRIAATTCLMRLRSRRRHPEEPLTALGPRFDETGHFERPVVDWSPLADERLEEQELGQQLRAAIDALPESYRSVLVLADLEHLPMKDIGEALDLSVPAVKTRLHRARLAVREQLTAYLEGRA